MSCQLDYLACDPRFLPFNAFSYPVLCCIRVVVRLFNHLLDLGVPFTLPLLPFTALYLPLPTSMLQSLTYLASLPLVYYFLSSRNLPPLLPSYGTVFSLWYRCSHFSSFLVILYMLNQILSLSNLVKFMLILRTRTVLIQSTITPSLGICRFYCYLCYPRSLCDRADTSAERTTEQG